MLAKIALTPKGDMSELAADSEELGEIASFIGRVCDNPALPVKLCSSKRRYKPGGTVVDKHESTFC